MLLHKPHIAFSFKSQINYRNVGLSSSKRELELELKLEAGGDELHEEEPLQESLLSQLYFSLPLNDTLFTLSTYFKISTPFKRKTPRQDQSYSREHSAHRDSPPDKVSPPNKVICME